MNFQQMSLLLWVTFALLDPDPDSESGSTDPIEYGSTDPIESGSNTDPDPQTYGSGSGSAKLSQWPACCDLPNLFLHESYLNILAGLELHIGQILLDLPAAPLAAGSSHCSTKNYSEIY
jgi:hypothetical protein